MEAILAMFLLVVCLVVGLRMLLGASRRQRLDAAWTRLIGRLQGRRPPSRPMRADEAARAAEDAIRRAREGGHWEGNVFKPRSFRRPKKPHKQ
jgi:hypothetical protein